MDKNELMLARDKNKSTMIEYEKPKIDGHLKFEEFNVGPKKDDKKIIKPVESQKTFSSKSPEEENEDEESQLELEEESEKSEDPEEYNPKQRDFKMTSTKLVKEK